MISMRPLTTRRPSREAARWALGRRCCSYQVNFSDARTWQPEFAPGVSASALRARLRVGKRTCEVIPCHRIQSRRNQFISFGPATPVRGFEPFSFPNIIDRKLPQAAGFCILGCWVNGGQQIPGACASAITSHAYHERLLVSSVPLVENAGDRAGPACLPEHASCVRQVSELSISATSGSGQNRFFKKFSLSNDAKPVVKTAHYEVSRAI